MMKKWIGICILGLQLAACKEAADKKTVIAVRDSTNKHTDSVAAIALPAVTPLPFGPAGSNANNFYKKDPWFYYKLIGEEYTLENNSFTKFTPTYPLPTIEKYTHATDDHAFGFCIDGQKLISVDSFFTITKYRVRLPDHEGFEVYYTTGDAAVDSLFPQRYKDCEMNYKLYGYLIFYERAIKTAHLLPAFFNWSGESDHSRQFYIDSNYHIFLYSEIMSEGEGGQPDIDGGPVEEVTINSKGEFTIKTVKKSRHIS